MAMAKSGKHRVSVLLFVVLAVAVSPHATNRVTAAGSASMVTDAFKGFSATGPTEVLKQVRGLIKATTTVVVKVFKDDEERSAAGPHGSGSTQLIENKSYPQLVYVSVTDIKVGDKSALDQKGSSVLAINPSDDSGGVLVSSNFPLTFLKNEAYVQLKSKISVNIGPDKDAQSELGTDVEQPCYKSTTVPPITLQEHQVDVDNCWYQQSDGSMCLAIMPSPWPTGETIIGTMLQAEMNVDGNKLTFQKSTKVGSGSGSSSKSNTAAATEPLLGVWVLLLLASIAC